MKSSDVLSLIGHTNDRFLKDAAEAFDSKHFSRISPKKGWLVAALIAAMLLLAGCVAYVLRLQDLSVGKTSETVYFDQEGLAIAPAEKIVDVVSFYGHSAEPIQEALKEWFDFLENYDPEGNRLTNETDISQIPNNYEYTYHCYTREMSDKINELSQKYDLKLLDSPVLIQRYQADLFINAMGISSFLLESSNGEIKNISGVFYPPENFRLEFEFRPSSDSHFFSASLLYSRKDYLPGAYPNTLDLTEIQQWTHTAPDETELLLALNRQGAGYIIHDSDSSMRVITIDGNESESMYPSADDIITKQELETFADAFSYKWTPQIKDTSKLLNDLERSEKDFQKQQAEKIKHYSGFAEYMKDHSGLVTHDNQYALMDLTGDGDEELIIGKNGAWVMWIQLVDGEIQEHPAFNLYLCENGITEQYVTDAQSDFEDHLYSKPYSTTAIAGPEGMGDTITRVYRKNGQWYQEDVQFQPVKITEEAAQSIIAAYPRVSMGWQDAGNYPLDTAGTTLADYVESSNSEETQQPLQEYKNLISRRMDEGKNWSTYFAIKDINGDGIQDLLLSADGERIGAMYTYLNGMLEPLSAEGSYLCQDQIFECVSIRTEGKGTEKIGHEFLKLQGLETQVLDFLVYNKATASWEADWNGTPLSEEEAQKILEQYIRIDPHLEPIEELLKP